MSVPALSQPNAGDTTAWHAEHWAIGNDIEVLPRIFEDHTNIAIMRRELDAPLLASVAAQCHVDRAWQWSWLGNPSINMQADLLRRLPAPASAQSLVDDIQTLAEAMAYLFDAEMVGIRLRLLDSAMCPRFHCDNLPVRLVTTYHGPGSEWLPEAAVNRAGLGIPKPDKPEIVADSTAIQQLQVGDLGLLKGSGWMGNEHRGLVHRSPALDSGQKRLLMTIDPA
uniref:DUF1826 domain-containing protein n=1 Tax=Halomonas sp. TaxID=1486246 RepID=UPI00260C6680|nr:DUF1826 domain-containing protein [Halomonas sp.]